MPEKFKKIVIRSLAVILIFATAAAAAGYLLIKLYIIPKYNAALGEAAEQGELLSEKDLLSFAKYFTDRQVIDNVVNFDKDSAEDILEVMQESEEEPMPTPKVSKNAWNNRITAKIDAVPTPTPTPTPQTEKETPKTAEGSTAKERIMDAASDEEISVGLAILSKISMSKVNELRRAGKTAELKAYIKSVLTQAEINKALSLYKKYNHLL